MSNHKFVIVNEQDNVIGAKEKEAITAQDIYRVSALWITNSQGDILLAQRSFNKVNHPGRWALAVAGTVEVGETYEENIKKEAREEIGLQDVIVSLGPKFLVNDATKFYLQIFTTVVDRTAESLTLKKDEVEDIKWFPQKELKQEITAHPEKFTPFTVEHYQEL